MRAEYQPENEGIKSKVPISRIPHQAGIHTPSQASASENRNYLISKKSSHTEEIRKKQRRLSG